MKSRLIRRITVSTLCLCAVTVLSGCINPVDLTMHPATREWKKQQEEQMRQIAEAQKQGQPAQQPIPLEEQDRQILTSQGFIKVGEEIPAPFALALLDGTWKGTACNEQMAVELKISTRTITGLWESKVGGIAKVKGVFKPVDGEQQAGTSVHETGLHGQMYLDTGFLALTSAISEREVTQIRQRAASEKKILELELSGLSKEEYEGSKGRKIREQIGARENIEKYLDMQEEIAKGKGALGPLRIDVGRSIDGSGWAGVIAGGGFAGCQIVLRSERGVRTEKLPPITSQVAMNRIRDPRYFYGTNYSNSGYWLDIAAKDAREEDFFFLAEQYEAYGKTIPERYARAADYYKILTDKHGDARAQSNLGRLYEKGLGVPKNPVKAQQLYNLARETRKKALEVCVTPAAQVFARQMLKETQLAAAQMGLLLKFYGIGVNEGNARVVAIHTSEVASLDKPFYCQILAQRINPKIDAERVPDGYYVEYANGEIKYQDNSLNKTVMEMGTQAAQQLAARVPFTSSFRVEPQGNSLYKLIWSDQSLQGSHAMIKN